MNNIDKINFSENLAELAADAFLKQNFGADIFIGADIETVLAERAHIIYQDIDDSDYYGALVHYHKMHFVVLNTHQVLRARYYSAAHELLHLAVNDEIFGAESKKIIEQTNSSLFDSERAADHFAAAVMLPKDAMITTWNKYVQDQSKPNIEVAKRAIVRIANVSSMPYMAVSRRLEELGLLLSKKLVKFNEKKWQEYLVHSNFPKSPLDKVEPFQRFDDLSKFIESKVDKKQLTLLEAANLLTHVDREEAKQYLRRNDELMQRFSGNLKDGENTDG